MRTKILLAAALVLPALTGCSVGSATGADDGTIVVGYQSRTINTVTAGTLLRARGYFEKRLERLGKRDGTDYRVQWQDYDTGAPITAQMLAGKIDIGSMGDYPLLINGSTAGKGDTATEYVATTGWNPQGALNGVVVTQDSPVTRLADLEGKRVSASIGSAGHGLLVRALTEAGIDPTTDIKIDNQQPPVGAAALKVGKVDAFSQFVAWPAHEVFTEDARLIYDGGRLGLPTLHGTVVRKAFADQDREVLDAFLQAQIDATEYLHAHPVEAAEVVAEEANLPAEVVYLYNGRNGVSSFDPTIKDSQRAALEEDVPFLKQIGVLDKGLDLDSFVNDSYLRKLVGDSYDEDKEAIANPAAITGTDAFCDKPVRQAATAGEIWVEGEHDTRPAADPTCLLGQLGQLEQEGKVVRAAYVPDALTGTRWFADESVWLREDGRLLPFATQDNADTYTKKHASARPIAFEAAVSAASEVR